MLTALLRKYHSIILLLFYVIFFAAPAFAENKSALEPQLISLPKGPGSISGLGESFEPQLNTGTATFAVKFEVPPGINAHQPEVILNYNSGYGNSPCGLGWELDIPYIQRQTDKGLPRYADTDTFIYASNGELVPLENQIYRLKIEGRFVKFLQKEKHWEAWEKDGTHLIFGLSPSARASNDRGIFKWFLEKSVNPNGNEIHYTYISDQGRTYPETISYTIIGEQAFNLIRFTYESRHDPFVSYVSRENVTTAKRLKTIEMIHQGSMVRKYVLDYVTDATFSLLKRITQYGKDGTSALPPLNFEYSAFDFSVFEIVNMANPPEITITNENADLVDINGDSLPDLVYTPHEQTDKRHRFYLNQGNGAWAEEPVIPSQSPFHFLDTVGTRMVDMNGDGLADLLVKRNPEFGYFRSKGNVYWLDSDWTACSPFPSFGFEDKEVRMVDLNNDRMTDVLRTDSRNLYSLWLNGKNCQWISDIEVAGVGYQFGDIRFKLGDMNGDGMEDMVYLYKDWMTFFPSKGYGEYDESVDLYGPAIPDYYLQGEKFHLNDMNNDGFADLLYVADGEIVFWLNTGQNSFAAPITLDNTPAYNTTTTAIRVADMDGDGLKDILYNDGMASVDQKLRYVAFNSGVHSNLLTRIDNGLGMTTEIFCKSSVADYLQAKKDGKPWEKGIPFPVHLVSRRVVTDHISGQEYAIDYTYHDGYYNGEEREFRGFGRVEKVEHGDPTAPTLKTYHVFDVGKDEESRKGMLLEQAALKENGGTDPVSGVYQHKKYTLETRNLANGTNDQTVRFSFTAQENTFVYEDTSTPIQLRADFDYDDYGNEIKNFNYGQVEETDFSVGDDEILTTSEYDYFPDQWMMDRVKHIRQEDSDGNFISDTKQFYDAKGNLIRQEKSPDDVKWIPVIRNQYDTYGNIIKITDANEHSRAIGWDATCHTFPVSETIDGLNLTMTAGYDTGFGKVSSFIDFNGHATKFKYDTHGRLINIIKPGDSETFPTQAFTYNLYDPQNGIPVSHIIAQTRENFGQAGTYNTYTYYDGLGRKLQIRSEAENGQWIVSEVVAFNQRMTEKKKWLPYYADSPDFAAPDNSEPWTEIYYDPTGRTIKEINPGGSFKTTQYLPLQKQVWDEEDNASGLHADTPHRFTYDGLERLVRVEERNGEDAYATQYGYDGLNNLTSILDNQGNLKTMSFDGLGRKTQMNDPDKGAMHYSYDDAGNLTLTLDNKNQTVTYQYDTANRILTENHEGVRVKYHYDDDLPADHPNLQNTKGRLAWVEDEAGRVAFSYNARGNMILKARKTEGYEFILGMDFDSMDRMTRLIYPDGHDVKYQYNAMNQLEAIPGYLENIDYQASGLKSFFIYANGVESAYDYDIRQRLKTLETLHGQNQLQNLTYTYDSVSNITAIADGRTNRTPESLTRAFIYDDLYRLTQCKAPEWQITYGYDSIGNLTQKTSDISDPKVNMGTLTYGEGTAGPHAVTNAGSYIYTYDGNGNVKTKTGYSFTFDHKDRMTAMNRAEDNLDAQYRYDYEDNRIVKTITSGDKTKSTIYIDKAAEVRGDQMILHVFAGDRRVARISKPFDPSALIKKPVVYDFEDFDTNGDGEISLAEIKVKGDDPQALELPEVRDALKIFRRMMNENPDALTFETIAAAVHECNITPVKGEIHTYFYIPDHLGSSSIMTDELGNVVEESVYYPYGMNRGRAGDFEAEYGFTGKELDDESEFHYFGARYYDSMVGRFVSVDQLYAEIRDTKKVSLETRNLYCYAENNPLRFIDPDGLGIKEDVKEKWEKTKQWSKKQGEKIKEKCEDGKQWGKDRLNDTKQAIKNGIYGTYNLAQQIDPYIPTTSLGVGVTVPVANQGVQLSKSYSISLKVDPTGALTGEPGISFVSSDSTVVSVSYSNKIEIPELSVEVPWSFSWTGETPSYQIGAKNLYIGVDNNGISGNFSTDVAPSFQYQVNSKEKTLFEF